MSHTSIDRSESVELTCTVCHDIFEVYAIGPCDHPVCYRCSTRMRVLCEQMDCPICRSPMPQVAFVYNKVPFKDINLRNCIPNRKYKIFFEDEKVEERYLVLLEYRCKLCHDRGADKTFAQLQTHMRRDHQLFACDLCVLHLKIFPHQRKFYSRKDLAGHRRVGDEDDKSYKGHPLCEFCDTRYNDKDELLKHLRKDHYFCHFCDQHGSNAYYDQYSDLVKHFGDSHHLCTEGDCANQSTRFTHAFASDIDLKAHKAQVHNKNLSKAQSREARTIELDFQLPPRRQGNNRGGDEFDGSSQNSRGNNDRFNRRRDREYDEDLHRALEASKESSNSAQSHPPVEERVPDPIHDFPSLNGKAVPVQASFPLNNFNKARTHEEEFPSLSSKSFSSNDSKKQSHLPVKQYSSLVNPVAEVKQPAPVQVKKESKPISLGSVSKAPRERWSSAAPKNTEDEYPALGDGASTNGFSSLTNSANWVKKSQPASKVQVVAPSSQAVVNNHKKSPALTKAITDENEFPSLDAGKQKRNVFGNSLIDRSKQYNKSDSEQKPAVKPKSEKYADSMFELPDSYYKSYDDSVQKAETTKVEEVYRKPADTIEPVNNNDFPGLPTRSTKVEVVSDKKKKKKNKKEVKPVSQQAAKVVSNTNASLNDIALALVTKDTEEAPKSSAKVSSKPPKPTDWFDNPPVEVAPEPQTAPEKKIEKKPKEPISIPPLNDIDNFPSLHTMSTSVQTPKPPPGFSPEPVSPLTPISAPPGFKLAPSITTPPPPGFKSNFVYIQPPDFKERNLKLIEVIRGALSEISEGFENFRAFSGQFRQGTIDASEYYYSCQLLMGDKSFVQIFPELLALLPDIKKQSELWEVHQAAVAKSRLMKASVSESQMSQCYICGQTLLVQDSLDHQKQHTSYSDFPILSGSCSNLGIHIKG